jgi:hypothetical protein
MAILAYLLSFGTALACAVLLTRAHRNGRTPLLFWSAFCFWGLSVSNGLAIMDVFVVPNTDMYWMRLGTALASVIVLLYGMVWEAR